MQRYLGSIAPCDHNAQTSQTNGQTDGHWHRSISANISRAKKTRKDAFHLYRVALNKIPHQTICNISATSGLIIKILEMLNPDTSVNLMLYNVLYNHTITIYMKITIFIIVLVLKLVPMTSVIIIPVLPKNSPVKNCNFHSNCFTR